MSILLHAERSPEKPALIMQRSGTVVTYGALNDASLRLAHVLRSQLGVGDRVALLMHNEPQHLIAAWAARRAGLYFVTVNWHLAEEEARYIVQNSGARALIVSPGLQAIALKIQAATPALALCFSTGAAFGPFAALDEAIARAPTTALEGKTEGIYMFYSSGTTGRPKGIKLPLPQVPFGTPSAFEQLQAAHYGFSDKTVYLSPAPLYHAAPMGWSMGTQTHGGTVILMEQFDAEAALRAIERHRVTHAQFVPIHFSRMLKVAPEIRARYDLSSLQRVVHGAAPCPPDVKRQMLAWLGPIIHEYYASSEGAGMTAVGPTEWLAHPGTVGRPLMGKPHILDDEGRELPPGEVGLIYFEGAQRFQYHDDPQKTLGFFNDKGWGCVGDMGWLDAEGYLYLSDRKSHMIISGGVNIYPQEIENVLIGHPTVEDVAVIGVPNDEYGEEVKAVVQLTSPSAMSPTLAAELIRYCRDRLSHFKCPRSVDFVEALPRLANGKLLKRELRKRYWPEGTGKLI